MQSGTSTKHLATCKGMYIFPSKQEFPRRSLGLYAYQVGQPPYRLGSKGIGPIFLASLKCPIVELQFLNTFFFNGLI